MKNNKKGFTLIELIVVLAILAVIAAIAVPTAFGAISDAQKAADTASVEGFNSAIRMKATLLKGNAQIAKTEATVKKAFDEAAIADYKPQQAKFNIYWQVPTTTSIGYLSMAKTGATGEVTISLTNASSFKTQIETTIQDKEIVYIPTP
ncbi:MAG: prepilin-type N-terminal cleavage/methylation domain-containing protein [Oscillospiraceae bacterium]